MIPFFGILQRFAEQAAAPTGDPAVAQLPLEIARGLPYNVTTEMDLALVADRADHPRTIRRRRRLCAAHGGRAGQRSTWPGGCRPLPRARSQRSWQQYGMRGLGEIDLGRPRWREQPEHIMQVLQSYLRIDDPAQAPDVVFARGRGAAASGCRTLEAAVRQTPRRRGQGAAGALGRRALPGAGRAARGAQVLCHPHDGSDPPGLAGERRCARWMPACSTRPMISFSSTCDELQEIAQRRTVPPAYTSRGCRAPPPARA